MQLPDTGFRYGGESGYNYTCENSDGNVPTLDERSLPKEYVLEKDHEVHFDNGRYCDAIDAISGYEADPAASLDSINSMIDDINSELVNNYLYTKDSPDPDLIIRPSGEQRLSNFLLWQCAYSEFWYSNVCWPDFTELDLQKAIYDYQNRDRRFGGV